MSETYTQEQLIETLAPFLNLDHLTERVALAMAHSEGNRQAQERAHLNNYDALGYTALAKAAVAEARRLGALAWPVAADAATCGNLRQVDDGRAGCRLCRGEAAMNTTTTAPR